MLSISTMIFDLRWPSTVLHLGHRTFTRNISNAARDTMLDTMEVIYESINRLPIGTVTFGLGWPWNMLLQGHQNYVKYFKTGDRYDEVNRSPIGNHPWAIDWHHDLWPWMTLNRPRSKSQNFRIKYLEYRETYNVRHNEGRIGNH